MERVIFPLIVNSFIPSPPLSGPVRDHSHRKGNKASISVLVSMSQWLLGLLNCLRILKKRERKWKCFSASPFPTTHTNTHAHRKDGGKIRIHFGGS